MEKNLLDIMTIFTSFVHLISVQEFVGIDHEPSISRPNRNLLCKEELCYLTARVRQTLFIIQGLPSTSPNRVQLAILKLGVF